MRALLGSLLLACTLLAAPYTITLSKTKAYEKEPIHLLLRYNEPPKEEILWVKFAPKPTKDWKVVLLAKRTTPKGYERSFLLFAKHSGKLTLPLELRIKRASKQEIRSDILGTGYEQTELIKGVIQTIQIKPLRLAILPAPKADLYGEFRLEWRVDKTKAKRYEPIYVTLKLRGKGYDQLPPIWPQTKPKVKILADTPTKKISYKSDGAHIEYERQFALLADRNFTLLPLRLKQFDFSSLTTLSTPAYSIEVAAVPEPLPAKSTPPKITPSIHILAKIVGYLFVFAMGGVTAVLGLWWLRRKLGKKWEILLAKDERELLSLLATMRGFESERRLLDEAISTHKRLNLWKMKRKIMKGMR